MKTCTILDLGSSLDIDIECGKPAKYYHRNDIEHVICKDCYLALFLEDIEIAAEYMQLAVSVYA